MATDTEARPKRERVAWAVIAGLALAAVGAVAYSYLSRPAQMGPSEAVFDTVDALYTAVRNHDTRRLGECEARLAGYRASGELPPAAADELAGVVAKARAGGWEAAAERLYRFMLAQRRDGAKNEESSRRGAETQRKQKAKH